MCDFVDLASPSIIFRGTNLSKSFENVRILKDMSFSIYQGNHVKIVGANGSGKSTLLKIIAAKSWPSSGLRHYYFDYKLIQSPLIARSSIRLICPEDQERMVKMAIPMTLREVIATGYSDSTYQLAVDQARDRTLDQTVEEFDLQAVEESDYMNVSHGTLKRAIIARALIAKPKLLVLDDALEGIDQQRIGLMRLLFRRLSDTGTTIVFSENRPQLIPILPDSELHITGEHRSTEHVYPVSQSSERFYRQKTEPQSIVALQNGSVELAGKPILHSVSLTIRASEHWALIGKNGSGKSSLARVIAGYQPIHGGSIKYFDENRRLSHWEIRTHCPLLSDTEQGRHSSYHPVFDVIASGFTHSIGTASELSDERSLLVEALLEDLQLGPIRDLPFGSLSFGMRRIVLFARSMVLQPSLVILDEFLSSLDDQNRKRILNYLARMQRVKGLAIINVSHVKDDISPDITGNIEMQNGYAHITTNRLSKYGTDT